MVVVVETATRPSRLAHFSQGAESLVPATRNNIRTSKSGPNMCFNILTWKFASRRNGVHFFDISTSKNAPNLVCFVHFDLDMCFAPQRRALHFFDISTSKSGPRPSVFNTIDFEMCFAPQRRALFRCLNFYKSAPKLRCFDVFCAFWLRNVLRAATACNFSSLI